MNYAYGVGNAAQVAHTVHADKPTIMASQTAPQGDTMHPHAQSRSLPPEGAHASLETARREA